MTTFIHGLKNSLKDPLRPLRVRRVRHNAKQAKFVGLRCDDDPGHATDTPPTHRGETP